MSLLITIVLLALMVILAIEDFRSRSIHVFYYPLILLLCFLLGWEKTGFEALILAGIVNLGILVFQLGVLYLFSYIRERRSNALFNKYLGIGDVLFLICICFLFTPLNFCLFLTVSLIGLVIYNGIITLVQSKKEKSIPLAGQLAILTIVVLILSEVGSLSFYDDSLTGDFLLDVFS